MSFATPGLRRVGAVATLLALLTPVAPVSGQPLHVVADDGHAGVAPAGALRARAVAVDVDALMAAGASTRPITIEAAGRLFEAVPTHTIRRPDGVSWFGAEAGGGRVTLTLVGGHLIGRIVTANAFVMIEPAGSGHVAYEPGPFPEIEDDAVSVPPGEASGAIPPPDVLFPDELHLMIVYTPAVAASLGGGLPVFMQAAEDVVNDVLQNSLVPIRARLVLALPLTYVESGNMGTDLSRLRSTADGFMDEVHEARDAYSADLVAMIVQTAGANCGIAYLQDPIQGAFATSGFSVTLRSCAIGNLTFPHELGHNIGLRHDRFVDPSNTPFTYSHGFVNDDSLNIPPGRPGLRTTLSYNDQCTSQGGTCTRVPYYSDPELTFAGQVLGDADLAHNARAAAFSLPTVATFRAAELLAEDDGNTVGGTLWRRPHCPDPSMPGACVIGDSAVYEARIVQTTGEGMHHLRVDAAHDAVVLLYQGPVHVEQPLRGLVGYAEPDSTAPAHRRLMISRPFQEGVAYTLVVTGNTLPDTGPWDLDVFGPPGGGIVVPAGDPPGQSDDHALGRPAPNPFRATTTLAVVVRQPQWVRVEAFDALGRRVAVVFDGHVAAGAPVALTLDGADLAAGAYVLRVTGETFVESARVTRLGDG